MGDFEQKIVLAIVAFLLGLLAEGIKRFFQRERRRLTYSINKNSIISVSQSLPPQVLDKLPTDQTLNIVHYRVVGENTGTQPTRDVNLLLVANEGAEIIHREISTIPAREVSLPSIENPASNEIRFKGINLERKQSVRFDVFLRSRTESTAKVFWSGGDNVDWNLSSATEEFGFEEHVVAIIRNYILAEFMPALFVGIFFLLASIIAFTPISELRGTSAVITAGSGLGQIIGSLIRFYFYLRIVPHAVAVVREIRQRRAQ